MRFARPKVVFGVLAIRGDSGYRIAIYRNRGARDISDFPTGRIDTYMALYMARGPQAGAAGQKAYARRAYSEVDLRM